MRTFFLGFMLGVVAALGALQLPTGRAEVAVRYEDHGINPTVTFGLSEPDNAYLYYVRLQLISDGERYDAHAAVERIDRADADWAQFKREAE